jgi:DNA-binding NtrC family response regulator
MATIGRVGADLVFCGTDREQYQTILQDLRHHGHTVPVVVASRLPETGDWLDAMDAGACDYCAAPFEAHLMQRIVESALEYRCSVSMAG